MPAKGSRKYAAMAVSFFLFHSPLLHTREDFLCLHLSPVRTVNSPTLPNRAISRPCHPDALIIMFPDCFIVDKKQNAKVPCKSSLHLQVSPLALAFITSYIKYELPMGGSFTLFSMFFICYIQVICMYQGWSDQPLLTVSCSLYPVGGSYFLSPFQTCCDYFFAFTALGLTGLWVRQKHGLTIQFSSSVLTSRSVPLRSAVIFTGWIANAGMLSQNHCPAIYLSFIIVILMYWQKWSSTLIVINLPPVKKPSR